MAGFPWNQWQTSVEYAALDKIRASGEIAKDVITAILDAIMGTAIDFIQTMRLAAGLKNRNSTS